MLSKRIGFAGVLPLLLVLTACCAPLTRHVETIAPTLTPVPTVTVPASPEEDSEQGETTLPYAAVAAEQALSESLGVPVEEIDIISHERQEWPDACLGLAAADEICAQVLTPGWRVVLRAGEREYVFRTDQNGEAVRQEGVDEVSESGEPMIVARGEFVGLGGHEGTGTVTLFHVPDGSTVLRLEGFAVTVGPDLYIYLVGEAEPAGSSDFGETLDLGLLESNEGDQEYAIPTGVDLSQYHSAVIYCLAYDALFARATLAE